MLYFPYGNAIFANELVLQYKLLKALVFILKQRIGIYSFTLFIVNEKTLFETGEEKLLL